MFHAAMALSFKRDVARPSPSNRVTVYVVANTREVRELTDSNNRFLGGLYMPRAGQSVALVPRLSDIKSRAGDSTETTLFHEYAHHFMRTMTSHTHPLWFSEGFAEFFSSARFTDDQIGIGTPAQHRAYDLAYARDVPIRDLLDYDGGASAKDSRYDSFYGQAWALFHYLVFAPERAGQLPRYEQLLSQGQPALQAAETAFGDLKQLEKDLDQYVQRRLLRYLPIKKKDLHVGTITVRVLPAAQAAIMPVKVRSRTGVSTEEAAEVVVEARRVAAAHPNDAFVLTALAEAEFDSDHYDAAIAAADRALALDPKLIDAHIQKGYALEARLNSGDSPPDAWRTVRSQWVKANKVEPDNPIPLIGFYESFLGQGAPPTANAILGLERALTVAPFDGNTRWMVAQQRIADGRLAAAAEALGPLAYSPHPGEHTYAARKLLEEVQSKVASGQGDVDQVGQID
jgi:tetratricopeptide (TPR) repeat protein